MKRLFILATMMVGLSTQAQDDIYDAPQPAKPKVYYTEERYSQTNSNNGNYENLDEDYNPNYDYRYSRSLRRMYDPYYMMPSSAAMGMYMYPQFAYNYNPYWGSGFTISIGNTWGNYWNNPWNSWNMGWNYGWNYGYPMSAWYGGWNYGYMNPWSYNYYNPWCSSYSYWGWNNNIYGGGWSRPYHRRSNFVDVAGNPGYSNAQLPQVNRYPRANGRYQNPNNAGSTFRRDNNQFNNNTPSNNPSRFSTGNGGGSFQSSTPAPSNNSGSFNTNRGSFSGRSSGSNSSWGNGGSNNNSSGNSNGGGGFSAPSRSGGSAPRGGRF